MDRTHAITRLNTEEIATEVNNVIKKGLDKLLGDYLYRYELLEQTHEAIMNLPSVRNHLNLAPLPQYNLETKCDSQILERLLKRIDELTFEVNQLKQTCKKEYTDIKMEDELVVVKLEQKENIRLEIEEASASEDDASEAEEEEEEEDASASEADDESSVAEEEEEAEENICSECDCKVILDEDIVVVDGKKFCGACDPSEAEEEDIEEEEENVVAEPVAAEEAVVKEPVASLEEVEEDDVETEKSESVASEAEEEEEEEAEEEEAEEEFIEIDIDDVTYCTNNEENGFIYELTEDGDVGDKVGYLKDGEPFFYADEK